MKARLLVAAAVAAAFATIAPQTQAFPPPGTPTTVNPGLLSGSGADAQAIFTFADAADTSALVLTGFGGNPIFNNSTNSPGNTVDLGGLTGPQQFGLNNLTTGTSFLADVADSDGNFHAFYTTNFADFSVGALPAAAAAAIAALPAGTSVVFMGWEDLTAGQGSDFDYNDLIFAFSNLAPPAVPEPGALMLLSLALAALGLVRGRR